MKTYNDKLLQILNIVETMTTKIKNILLKSLNVITNFNEIFEFLSIKHVFKKFQQMKTIVIERVNHFFRRFNKKYNFDFASIVE